MAKNTLFSRLVSWLRLLSKLGAKNIALSMSKCPSILKILIVCC